jgi:hypothetical protein
MPEKLVCRACGTEVDVPGGSLAQREQPVQLAVDGERTPELDLRRLFLVIGYLVVLGGLAAFFLLGIGFEERGGLFLWPIQTIRTLTTADGHADNVVLGSSMRLLEDKAVKVGGKEVVVPVLGISLLLALVVAGGLVAVPRGGLAIGIVIAAVALAGYCGYRQYRQQADWGNLTWLYDAACAAALLAVFLGLVLSQRWIVLGWFVPGIVAIALAIHYLNLGVGPSLREQWLPAIAGVFQGLVIGLAARVASWILNRDGASTLLGAFAGAFLGMLLVDRAGMREFLRTPEFRQLQLPLVSLYAEIGLAFVLAVLTGFLGKRVMAPGKQQAYGQGRRLGYGG